MTGLTIGTLGALLVDLAVESPLGFDTPILGWVRTPEDEVPPVIPTTGVVLKDNEQLGGIAAFITLDHRA